MSSTSLLMLKNGLLLMRPAAVTSCEKKMLLTAMILAIWLGIFH